MIAFGLEDIVVFVFDLPTGASVTGNGFDSRFQDRKISAEGVLVELLASVFTSDRQFAPIVSIYTRKCSTNIQPHRAGDLRQPPRDRADIQDHHPRQEHGDAPHARSTVLPGEKQDIRLD